ncbi:MAG TPA: LysE family transporter [Candidatus Nanoarchaeia archaeon]|nr:LysE family transporter [Candidatus Nanoarchaeia archaeon]
MFLTIALIHLLAVASPGPDFAIVLKQSVSQPRRIVYFTSLGVALGMLLHVMYSLVGIGFIIARSVVLFSIIKWLGALYLIFIGWKSLTTKPPREAQSASSPRSLLSPFAAVRMGFLCNALNPKATLFFLALFTQVIDASTPFPVQIFYGAYLSFATFVWFCGLGSVLTMKAVQARLQGIHLWAERVMGAALIALGVRVALSARE